MRKHEYLNWMSKETPTKWCNDSAIVSEIKDAINCGASGCTTNPPLSFQALTETKEIFQKERDKISSDISGDERVLELIGIVVRYIASMFFDMYEKSCGEKGYVRSQVQPDISTNASAMLEMGKKISSWGKNVMVKIPATKAGVWVLEELAAIGIPTTPTVCVSVSQIVAVAEANERGIKRAIKNGLKPAASTAAFVMGRLQDHLLK